MAYIIDVVFSHCPFNNETIKYAMYSHNFPALCDERTTQLELDPFVFYEQYLFSTLEITGLHTFVSF